MIACLSPGTEYEVIRLAGSSEQSVRHAVLQTSLQCPVTLSEYESVSGGRGEGGRERGREGEGGREKGRGGEEGKRKGEGWRERGRMGEGGSVCVWGGGGSTKRQDLGVLHFTWNAQAPVAVLHSPHRDESTL